MTAGVRAIASMEPITRFVAEQWQRNNLANQISCLLIGYRCPCADRRFHGVALRCLAWWQHLKSHALCARQRISPWLAARQSQLFQGLQIFVACRTREVP